ncbi:MAG: hypothetical protein HY849_00195 [Nitrosomonadales bacterium]|nr:hypothetical protein [Nitrosomonadales bacterium]
MVQAIAILLGLYLLAESIAAAALMPGGDRACRVVKYMVTGIVGVWMIFDHAYVDTWHLIMGFALALFLLPKMVERIETHINQLWSH